MASLLAKICSEWLRKRENKKRKLVPMSSCPARNRKLKKIAKIFKKIKKHHRWFFPSQNKQGKAEKERKKKKQKKIVPMSSYPTRNRKLKKFSKKIQKNLKTPLLLLSKPK